MVRTENLIVYRRARELVAQTCRDKEIIYAPTCVLLSRMKTIAPPGIRPGKVGIKEPERIGKTAFEQQGELSAFLVGKTGIASVCRRILQIYLVVRHVHVAANHYGLGLRKLEQVFAEGVVPRHAVVEPRQTVLRVATLKRIMPRAQGRAYRILKRTSHMTVVLKEKE